MLFAAAAALAAAAEGGAVSGVVRDPAGAVVAGVAVSLSSPQGAIAASTASDAEGTFRLAAVPPGSYVLVARGPGFAPRRLAVQVEAGRGVEGLRVDLQPEAFRDEVTVTATPGRAAALEDVAQRVNVIGEETIALRTKAVLAQAAGEEVGLHVQRTSPTLGGVFVRGLTGAKVNVYVDGVRYTTSAQRGGISTFFDLVEPEVLEGIEVVRGPSSA
jgi:hemoglobin/transferrin/lactoferrin receptor protein